MNLQQNIIEVIEEKRLMWFGYYKRIENDRIRKMILAGHGGGEE